MSWEPAWKSLVEQLVEEGYESPYLDRLRETYDPRAPSESLEREILREMAAALGRAEAKVLAKLLELELLEKKLALHPDRRTALAFNAKREEALRARRDLMIHREAMFSRRDPGHDARYPVPDAVAVPEEPPPSRPERRFRWPWQ